MNRPHNNPSDGGRTGGKNSAAEPPLEERGIALVLVLWLTLVLAVMAVSVVRIAHGDVRIAFNVQEAAKAEALADGGVYLAIAALMNRAAEDAWPMDGSVQGFILDGERVSISVRDEGAKINLNSANYEMLEGAALSVGLSEEKASRLADALIAERQTRSGKSAANRPRPTVRRSSQFATIRELQPAANLTRADYERLRDYITVYVGQRAPGGLTRALVQRSALLRPANRVSNRRPTALLQSGTFAITSKVELSGGAGFERYAVIRLRAGGVAGYQVLHWD